MKPPTLLNYYQQFKISQEALLKLEIDVFPISIENIMEELGILVTTVTEYKKFREITNEVRPYIKIKDGRTYKKGNQYLIVYNDSIANKQRIRFTLCHELAHIILGHLNDERTEIDRGGISDEAYYELENQANVFAGNFLAPPVLMAAKLFYHEFPYKENAIRNTFGISMSAVKNFRLPDLNNWLKIEKHLDVEYLLFQIHEKEICISHCKKCHTMNNGYNVKYCKVCGGTKFNRFKGEKIMEYSKIELNEQKHPIKCPICENEYYVDNAEYCHICGAPALNNCLAGCALGHALDGDARYCPYCGETTTFYKYKILKPWDAPTENIGFKNFEGFEIFDNASF